MTKELSELIEEKFEEYRPKGFNSGECPQCSDLSIGFKAGATFALSLDVLSKAPEVEALLKYAIASRCEDEIFTDVCGHPHLRHSKTCDKCEVLKLFQESWGKDG